MSLLEPEKRRRPDIMQTIWKTFFFQSLFSKFYVNELALSFIDLNANIPIKNSINFPYFLTENLHGYPGNLVMDERHINFKCPKAVIKKKSKFLRAYTIGQGIFKIMWF